MLNPDDRDWIQEQALEVQRLWKRGSDWHGNRGLVVYLAAASGLAAVGGIVFGNREIGAFGSTLAVIIGLCLGGYYYFRQQEDAEGSKRRREIEERFKAKGLDISYDGRQVSDGTGRFNPLSSDSYERKYPRA